MANSIYSAHKAAGASAGKYKASLMDMAGEEEKMAFADKKGAWEQEKLSKNVGTIADTLEYASTVGGGWQDKQKFGKKLKLMEGKYGSLKDDTRSGGQKGLDWLFGKEREYTFGEGKDAKTFSKAGVGAKGGALLGESMLDEAGLGIGENETSSAGSVAKKTLKDSVGTNLWQTASGGLTSEANTKLYGEDPSMKGKSKEIRAARYKELFEGGDSRMAQENKGQMYDPEYQSYLEEEGLEE